MALPALHALSELGRLFIQAPRWGALLYRDVRAELVPEPPEADVAVLFPPSFRAAWEARHIPRRIGFRGDGRGWLLTDALRPQAEHRAHTYGELLAPLGHSEALPSPSWRIRERDRALAPPVPRGHLALAPLSPSGPPVMWGGFHELAARWPGEVRVYTGPGESWSSPRPVLEGLPLDQLAACLERAQALVVNDSGLSHFARALDVRTVVVHGSTTPQRTGALGSTPVEGAELPCRPCYAKRCRIGTPCLDISVERVLEVL